MEADAWPVRIKGAQGVMDGSDRSGDGRNGGALWLPKSGSQKNPIDDKTHDPAPLNGNPIDWEHKQDPQYYDYPYGGVEDRSPGNDNPRDSE